MKIRRTLLSGWLLICLLLTGQFTLLAHEADHSGPTVSAPCLFCLGHATFEGAAPATVIALTIDHSTSGVADYQTSNRPELYSPVASEPRAPPHHS